MDVARKFLGTREQKAEAALLERVLHVRLMAGLSERRLSRKQRKTPLPFRRIITVNSLRVFVAIIVLWGEYVVFWSAASCKWPDDALRLVRRFCIPEFVCAYILLGKGHQTNPCPAGFRSTSPGIPRKLVHPYSLKSMGLFLKPSQKLACCEQSQSGHHHISWGHVG